MTRQELQEALTRFAGDITAVVRAEVKAGIAEVKAIKGPAERAQESTRTKETDRLTSFYLHAKAQSVRLNSLEAFAYGYGLRLAAIEERLLNLESRRQ